MLKLTFAIYYLFGHEIKFYYFRFGRRGKVIKRKVKVKNTEMGDIENKVELLGKGVFYGSRIGTFI
jgi:hypothetical protein